MDRPSTLYSQARETALGSIEVKMNDFYSRRPNVLLFQSFRICEICNDNLT